MSFFFIGTRARSFYFLLVRSKTAAEVRGRGSPAQMGSNLCCSTLCFFFDLASFLFGSFYCLVAQTQTTGLSSMTLPHQPSVWYGVNLCLQIRVIEL